MYKLKYLLTRIKNLNYKSLFQTINKIHHKTGKFRILIFLDVIYCGFKYQAGYIDYNLFEMYNMNRKERKTVVTRGKNNELIKKYNNKNYFHYFHNKNEFNKKFQEYLKRDWLYIDNNYEEFCEFVKKHPKFIAKPIDLECGKNIEMISIKKENLKNTYQQLIEKRELLIEEIATQCKEISKIHPYSINTIRIVTFKNEIIAAFIRIGDKKNIVDNFNHDGLLAPINIETGKIEYPAVKKDGTLYTHHPLTKEKIQGITIPKWEEAKEICVEASKKIKEIGYIGFDVCIGEHFCSIIEANEYPGHDLYALPAHRSKNIGFYPRFLEIIEREQNENIYRSRS